jgi:hypothetical protein
VFLLSFRGSPPTAESLQAQLWTGEGTPSLFPVPAERGQGLPHPQLRKRHRPPTSHSEETPGDQRGRLGNNEHLSFLIFTHLSLAGASMKIWCFLLRDTAIKWRENAQASATSSPQERTGVSERTTIKLAPPFHFEYRFSGVQLLVVEEPCPLALCCP